MGKYGYRAAAAILAVAVAICGGCASKDARNESVATVNGDEIRIGELREFLGSRGGVAPSANIPVEKKKEALDRLVSGRLLAQDARGKGLDNTQEFRNILAENEKGILINALLRKEIDSRVKIRDSEIKDEAKKLRDADKTLSEAGASAKAGQGIADREIRKVEGELVAAAKKDFPITVNMDLIRKIGKDARLEDNSALATVGGGDRITYGQVRKVLLQGSASAPHGAEELAKNPVVVQRVVDREAMGQALHNYAKKQGLAGSEWFKASRAEMERAVLINLLAEKAVAKNVTVTEKEIADAYAEHGQMLVRDGKKMPLAQVKDQLRAYLENVKRSKALEEYVAALKQKAKITIHEEMLPKV